MRFLALSCRKAGTDILSFHAASFRVRFQLAEFGSASDLCRSVAAGGGVCSAFSFSAIAFGVLASVPALIVLVLFLLKLSIANQVDAIAAPVLFVFICIGTALSCRLSLALEYLPVFAFTAILAFIASILLNIYNIMNASLSIKISATDASEKPAVTSEPVPSAANV